MNALGSSRCARYALARPFAAALLLLAANGCAVLAGKSDYADYRAVRLSRDEHAQLVAMQHYVQRHPDGHWFASVQATRESKDISAFESGKGTRAGLTAYLQAFPDGVFAAQAQARLSAIALIEQRQREEVVRAEQLLEARKLREAELSRTWMTRFVFYWLKTLTGLSAWGEPVPQVAHDNPAFSRAFGAEPRPRCTRDECVKYYASHYAVPVPGGTRVERSLSLLLRLTMKDGKLQRAELLLPDHGFSRWFEIEQRSAVVEGDAEARRKAVEWAQADLMPLLKGLGDGRIEAQAGYVLAPIARPAIGPTGEQTDTTAEDPSAPRTRMDASGASNAQPSGAAGPDVAELIKPNTDPAPDMVFTPLQVDKNGHAVGAAQIAPADNPQPTAAAPAEAGDVMVMAPVAVPSPDGTAPLAPGAATASGAAAAAAPAAPPPTVFTADPGVTAAFHLGALRVVLFAAPSDAPAPGYDGLLIEPLAAPPALKPATPPARAVRPARH